MRTTNNNEGIMSIDWKRPEEELPEKAGDVLLRIYRESDKEVFYRRGYFNLTLNTFTYYCGQYDYTFKKEHDFYEHNQWFENKKLTHYEIITEPKEIK